MIQREPIEGIRVTQDEHDYRHFFVKMDGPKYSPFEGGVFPLEIFCPESYPQDPPEVHFRCKVYHPQVNASGEICIHMLKKWAKANDKGDEELCWLPKR